VALENSPLRSETALGDAAWLDVVVTQDEKLARTGPPDMPWFRSL
jgi:hypothetical protein